MKTSRKIVILIAFILTGITLYAYYDIYANKVFMIENIMISSGINDDNTKTVIVNIKGNTKNALCSIDDNNWIDIKNQTCTFNVQTGNYHVKIKKDDKLLSKELSVNINGVKNIDFNVEKYYLAVGEKAELNYSAVVVGNAKLKWETENSDIVTVSDGIIEGIALGKSMVSLSDGYGQKSSVEVIVTDLLVKPVINDKKSFLPCKAYTEEEAQILDEALAMRVKNKGVGTRAALIEVIRFLTLSLKYKISYFYENGRLTSNETRRRVDGEGRYYHIGLYLSESKFKDIEASYKGPAIWGCPLTNLENSGKYKPGNKYPNGLDCSGFVTWALYNAGIDVGDIGAGIDPTVKDVSDVGVYHDLTYDYANSNEYKVGDIIARWGHTALIAGKDDEYLYIAESLLKGVRIEKVSYKKKNSGLYTYYAYINTLDDEYSANDNYEDMWYQ